MTINEYQEAAKRTDSWCDSLPGNLYDDDKRLLNGLMGLNGEAGEAIDILKKYWFQDHDLDVAHLAEELGDVAWYLAISADAIGFDLETIFRMNIEKLRRRYPEGFDPERSINRDEN